MPGPNQQSDATREAERRSLRPYRVTMYVIYLAFTLTFIFLIARSVWVDLYGREPVKGLRTEHPAIEACVDELERLFGQLQARSAFPSTPSAQRDWDLFTRDFEDRLGALQSKCVTDDAAPGQAELRKAIRTAAEHLETWRQHLSRCGEEGEEERSVLVKAISELRIAAKRGP